MTKTRSTKRALLTSVLCLVLCVSMLVGTTFAWFTDSVTSAGNKIQAGTLKLDLELLDKDGNWNSIKEEKNALFDYDKWEPGYVDVKILKVENEGNLALKWYAKFVSENDLSILADVIDVYVKPSEDAPLTYPADRNLDGYTKVGTVAEFVNTIESTTYGDLKAGEAAYLGIALKMQESAGNTYQGLELGAFDIMLLATQDTVEADSFGTDYDADAEYPLVPTKVDTQDDLVTVLSEGGYALLKSDLQTSSIVNLAGGILDGNGNEISTENTTGIVDATGGTIQSVGLQGIETKKQIGRIEKVFIPKIGITSTDGLTQNLVIDEVTVENTPRAISLDANNNSVYASNSTFANIVYIYNQEIAVFENCTFTTDEQANENDTAWIGLGGDMTFINCHFEESVDFYVNNPDYTGTITFINCTYGNNGVEDRPIEASVDFFTYWMEYSVSLYDGTFGEGDPGRTNFTCIVDDTVVWEATN